MINSNLANPMLVIGAATVPAKPAQAPARGDNAFEEALAGANAVRDRDATTSPSRDANASRTADRSQIKTDKREDAPRNDAPSDDRSVSQDATTQTVSAETKATDQGATGQSDGTEGAASGDAEAAAAAAAAAQDAAAATAAAADAGQQANAAAVTADAQSSVVVAAAPVVTTEIQAATDVAPAVTNPAIDAALKLALGAAAGPTDAEQATTVNASTLAQAPVAEAADALVTADAVTQPTLTTANAASTTQVDDAAELVATTAPITNTTQDAEVVAGADAQTGPTRPIASTNAQTTAGPTPDVQIDAGAEPTQQGAAGAAVDTEVHVAVATGAQMADTAKAATTAAVPVAQQAADDAAVVTTPIVTAAAATANTEVEADAADAGATTTTDASVEVAAPAASKAGTAGGTSTGGDTPGDEAGQGAKAQADAILQPTKPVVTPQTPVITEQLETAVQVSQTRAAEKEAIAEGGAAPTQSVKPLDATSNLLQNLQAGRADASAAPARTGETVLTQNMQERLDTIAEQLATRLRLSQAAGGSQVQLSLKPRELGDVTVQMKVREGVVAATVFVDRPDALNTIETHIAELRKSLEDQGLSIQRLDVDVRGDWGGAAGANAQAFADARNGGSNGGRPSAAQTSLAGAAGAIPGLTSDREVDVDEAHEGDVSVLI